jgi:hypothetical protein
MSAGHTPGPWEISGTFEHRGDPSIWANITPVGYKSYGAIAQVSFFNELVTFDPVKLANARLIAAAPELLDALQFIREHGEEFSELAAKKAISAINKATGATP